MAIKIYPYKMGSAGAKALAERLDCKRVFPDKAYRSKGRDLVVNWGASQEPRWAFLTHYLNHPDAVRIASDKFLTLSTMLGEIITPAYTTSMDTALTWFEKGVVERVYCRKKLTGHSGDGIIIANNPDELVEAPLYVKGIVGYRDEYRVHVFNGEVIDVQMKRKKVDAAVDTHIRSHHNGYVYCREGLPPLSDNALEAAINSVAIVGLDFGAVDIIVMRNDPNDYYVLEVNTAPGLEGTTLGVYADAIERYHNEIIS